MAPGGPPTGYRVEPRPRRVRGRTRDRVVRITDALGDITLGGRRAEQIATWQAQLLQTLGPQTVVDTRSTLRSIIEEALALGLVASNHVAKVRPPRTPRAKRRALTHQPVLSTSGIRT